MALFKEIVDKKGIVTNYHKINKISMVKRETTYGEERYTVCANVSSYTSEEYRRISTSNAVQNKDIHLDVFASEISQQPIFEITYNKLKNTTDFIGAEDC